MKLYIIELKSQTLLTTKTFLILISNKDPEIVREVIMNVVKNENVNIDMLDEIDKHLKPSLILLTSALTPPFIAFKGEIYSINGNKDWSINKLLSSSTED